MDDVLQVALSPQEGGAGQTDECENQKVENNIHTAAWQGNTALLTNMLKNDPILGNVADDTEYGAGFRPLHYAAYQGNLSACRLLVEHGAKTNLLSDRGVGAVFLAAQQDQVEVLRFLLEQGADPTMCEAESGLCAVDVAEHSPGAMQIFKNLPNLVKPENCQELPLLRAVGAEVMEMQYATPGAAVPWRLPIQALKVQIFCGTDRQPEQLERPIQICIAPKTMPVYFKSLEPGGSYSVQVACINALGAGPYGPRSECLTLPLPAPPSGAAAAASPAKAKTPGKSKASRGFRQESKDRARIGDPVVHIR